MATIGQIDALLPQTQCTRCGYRGCAPYAEAIQQNVADINQCPPGGEATIHSLAALLGREPKPLNPANGIEAPARVAWIDETQCIGCAKCLAPCPVDAIVGAQKFLHTVVTGHCTGCELCIAPCPVDCIHMRPVPAVMIAPTVHANRSRYGAHQARLALRATARAEQISAKKSEVTRLANTGTPA